jgi:hypothetical protein
MKDLKLVFRDSTDLGASRTKSTPKPDQIITNLDLFVKKWKACAISEWRLINDKVLKEVASLKLHITKLCLSGIPPKSGTNHNEALHRVLNTTFSRLSKIGLPLALALITITLYQHNSKIAEKVTGILRQPIALLKQNANGENVENFGIIPKELNDALPHWLSSKINNNTISSLDLTCISLSEEASKIVSLDKIIKMIENTVHLTKLSDCLHQFTSNSPIFNATFLPFVSSVNSIFLKNQPAPITPERKYKRRRCTRRG